MGFGATFLELFGQPTSIWVCIEVLCLFLVSSFLRNLGI